MKLVLSDIEVKKFYNSSRMYCLAQYNNTIKKIWFEVPNEYGSFFSSDVYDSFLIGILPWVIRKGYDVEIKGSVSENLIDNLNHTLIPRLCEVDSRVKPIQIIADTVLNKLKRGTSIGCNHSLGVDSFYVIQAKSSKHVGIKDEITHLLLFNFYNSKPVNQIFTEKCKAAAKALNKPMLEINSNVHIVFRTPLLPAHTYWLTAAIHSLKIWDRYYIASSYSRLISMENVLETDCSHYESFLLSCLSTNDLKIELVGEDKTRLEKMNIVSENEVAQKFLSPCWRMNRNNCGWCAKCKRTLIDLDITGNLDYFSDSFDISLYKKMKKFYYCILVQLKDDEEFYTKEFQIVKARDPEYLKSVEKWNAIYYKKYASTPDWTCSAASDECSAEATLALAKMYGDGAHSLGYPIKANREKASELILKAYEMDNSLFRDCVESLWKYNQVKYREKIKQICSENIDDPYCKYILFKITQETGGNIDLCMQLLKEAYTKDNNYATELASYLLSVGTTSCSEQAVSILKKGVKRGDDSCKLLLSRLYGSGNKVPLDLKKAIDLISDINEYDSGTRMEYADLLYRRKEPKDDALAYSLVEYEIDFDNPNSYGRLARFYRDGRVVEKNREKMLELYSVAYALNKFWGNEYADALLTCNDKTKDELAFSIYERLALEGDNNSMGRLGRMYRDGRGTQKDLKLALHWFNEAYKINNIWANEYNKLKKQSDSV